MTGLVDYADKAFDDDIWVLEKEMQGVPTTPVVRDTHQLGMRLSKVDLTGLDGKDDMWVEACTKFLDDDSFLKSEAFMEFSYTAKRDEYVNNLAIERSPHPELPDAIVKKKVLNEMRVKFEKMNTKEG